MSVLLDRLLAIGARVAIVTGTELANVDRQLAGHIRVEHRRRLFVSTNRGSEVFGFDRRGAPLTLWRRVATPEEDRLLDQIADEVCARLGRLTGLSISVVRNRLNRRKIDLIPEPEWADPPKSAIAALLAATEARLRGAGLANGVRGAFELALHVARDAGLPDAKVTSDVKHIEVGLTDKSDAMAYVLEHIALPLEISAEDTLVVGDEFGPIGGFEASDHRMLAVAGLEGATIVSVGPEPSGAPEGIVHLGGGPDRFCAILERQLALERELGPFAPPRDAAWSIEEPGFDVAREHEIESLLAISNGYVGSRGSIAEGTSVSRPATFIAGAFEPSADPSAVPELVIAPDWGRLRFVIDGEPLAVERGEMLRHRRVLDMRRGVLLREAIESTQGGRLTDVRTIHLASSADRHVLVEGVRLCPQNFTGTIRVDAILSGDVKSASGATHWAGFEADGKGSAGPLLVGHTRRGLRLAMASHMRVGRPSACEHASSATTAAERCSIGARIGEPSEMFRTVTLFTSRDADDPRKAALERAESLPPLPRLVAEHERAWAAHWRRADVEIDGAPSLERALRFATYHLLSAANPEDSRCSIGARALAGEAYRGHVFWDTETFMLPLFVHAWPEAARAMLMYRHRTLDGARRKARGMGFRGALYAWESADTGDEATPSILLTPMGELIRVLSGDQEHHIAADVAYAVGQYVRATGDRAFADNEGLEILVETARFWASRVERQNGVAHIRTVIGPDEYHESIDDNAFTNWMARENLWAAAHAVEQSGNAEVQRKLELRADEPEEWREVARAMYLGADPQTGLIEQFAGYFALEPIDLAEYASRTVPMDVVLGRTRTRASQVVKQADVVQLVAMLWDRLEPRERRDNFLFYEPRTAHGSSLSPGVHALVSARLGFGEMCASYLEQTASVDLANNMGNASGGVHAAAMGSLWQAVVFGVAGLRPSPDDEDALVIAPHLLPGWRHLHIPFGWRGSALEIAIEPGSIEVTVEGADAKIVVEGEPAPTLRAKAGRRWVCPRKGGRLERWEETRA